jgi:hypothetical protein
MQANIQPNRKKNNNAMKKLSIIIVLALITFACGKNNGDEQTPIFTVTFTDFECVDKSFFIGDDLVVSAYLFHGILELSQQQVLELREHGRCTIVDNNGGLRVVSPDQTQTAVISSLVETPIDDKIVFQNVPQGYNSFFSMHNSWPIPAITVRQRHIEISENINLKYCDK